MNRIFPVLLLALSIGPAQCVLGQNYTYSYGNSRVNVESLNGRSNPSSTYIGPGTVSKSAQGIIKYGAQVNPGLPKVNRGNYIGTPGDNLYTMTPILSHQDENKIIARRPNRIIYRQQPKKIQGTYVPDPNVPLNYANYQSGSSDPEAKNVVNRSSANNTYSKETTSP